MKLNKLTMTIALATGLAVSGTAISQIHVGTAPDFKSMKNTKNKKAAFIGYILPQINDINKKICKERVELFELKDNLLNNDNLSSIENNRVKELGEKYKLKFTNKISIDDLNDLLLRVDIVPDSLVLTQAALESGWGTSRFARLANNYFGQHCFSKGCGLEAKYAKNVFVTKYPSSYNSIKGYLRMLNTNNNFKEFRVIRANLHENTSELDGLQLMKGLSKYSELGGKAYQKLLTGVIKSNNMTQYDHEMHCK